MKQREEMLRDLHRRMDEYEADQRAKRAKITKVAASVTPVCAAAVVGVGLWKGGAFTPHNDQLVSSTVESTASDVILSADNDASTDKHSANNKNNADRSGEPTTSVSATDQQEPSAETSSSLAAKNGESATADSGTEHASSTPADSVIEDQEKPAVTNASVQHTTPSVSQTITSMHNDSGLQVIWAEDMAAVDDFYEGFTVWHQFDSVGYRLYEALEAGDDDDIFAILARPSVDYTFRYNGKTLAEYYTDMCNERNLSEILAQLLKEGDSLKFGEALYKTGTPSGEKWAQSWYEERIAYYGETILGKYIVDGEFLSGKVEQDIAAAKNSNEATVAYKTAYEAYLNQVASSVKGVLPAEVVVEDNGIIMYLTRDGFSKFSADRIDGWTFDLAFKNGETTYQYGIIEDE